MIQQSFCHLATNSGKGGVSVIILWGDEAMLGLVCGMLRRGMLSVGELVYGWLQDDQGNPLDEVLLACPKAGMLLLSGHGGTANSLSLLKYLVSKGFTESYNFGDVMVGDAFVESFIGNARTEGQLAALFKLRDLVDNKRVTEEFIVHKAADILRPRRICLVGAPNTGKSSLLNKLCGGERVLVSPHEGTTLDAVEHWLDIGGYDCVLVDTAGIREQAGVTEQEAIRRSGEQIAQADAVVFVTDGSREWSASDGVAAEQVAGCPVLMVANKADLDSFSLGQVAGRFSDAKVVPVSCVTGMGLEALWSKLVGLLGGEVWRCVSDLPQAGG